MNAVVLHEYGGPEQLKYETVADPEPKDGEILVRVAAASLNPIDWKLRSGALKTMMPLNLPAILGRDVAGTVETIGAGVTRFNVGSRVLGLINHGYAEQVVGKEEEFALIPEGMDFETAAALPLVLLTGEQLITRGAKVKAGQTVLVTGALGSVGRSAVYTAMQAGCQVIAGVRGSQKTEAMALGVEDAVALDDPEDIERLAPYEVVADTVGGDVAATLVTKMQQGGSFGSVLGDPANAKDRPDVQFGSVHAVPDAQTMERMAHAVAAGEFSIPIGKRFPLRDAAEAQTVAEKGNVGKVLLIT